MEFGLLQKISVVVMVSMYMQGGVSQYTISDCASFRAVSESFSSCALYAMYNSSERNTVIFDKNVIQRQDLIDVVNYWCSILEMASSCTSGGALQCWNRQHIISLVRKTGGVCQRGEISDEYKNLIPAGYTYNKRCMSQSLDVIDACENQIPEIGNDVSIADGVLMMRSIIENTLECNARQLRKFPSVCVGSNDGILFFTLRALTFSVPHALGVELPVSVVMDIINQ